MNIENKIKLLERFKNNPARKSNPIGEYVKEDEFNSYESLIDEKELNFNFIRFLSVQLPENREFIYKGLKQYTSIEELISLSTNEYPIVSKENIKWVALFLKYEKAIEPNIYDFNKFLKSVKDFKLDNGYELVKYLFDETKDGYGISYSKLSEILRNANFNEFSFEEIYEIILNSRLLNSLSDLDRRTIELYTDKVSTIFSDVTEDNFNFVKNIEKLCGFEYLKSISLYIDEILEYKKYINSILDIIDEDEQFKYIKMFIDLFIICVRNDSEYLIKECFDKLYMKISYGNRAGSLKELFEMGFEVELNKEDNGDISYSDGLDLAKIKSIGSKGLYNKVKNNSHLTYLIANNVKYLSQISDLINLGQLNESEIYTLINNLKNRYYRHDSFLDNVPYKLSFKEFEYAVKYKLPREVFEYVSNLKISSRIKVFDILMEANKNNSDLYSTQNIIKNILAEDLLKKHNIFGSSNIQDYIRLKLTETKIGFQIDSMYELDKINTYFDLCGEDYFIGISKDNIDIHLLNNKIIKEGFETLKISNEFILENLSNTIEFIVNGGFKIATSYFNNYYVKELQKENLTLIVKSILVGKYDALKFNYSDIYKEIEINMSEDKFKSWATDHEISNEIFTIKDAGDFNTIMTIGEKPVRSCMNYVSGSYSQCLLSNIDTAKKILTIHKNGVYVGRAILRLTKSSSTGNSIKRLSFIDVENEVSTDIDNSDEKLVLFVERLYTSLDSKDLNNMYDLMIEFLRYKSDLVGAKLMVSSSYTDLAENSEILTTTEPNYIFITASKNGQQYLDSFDGSTSSSCCYKKADVLLY